MKLLDIENLNIPDIKVIKFARFADERGYFTESYNTPQFLDEKKIKDIFEKTPIAQINESYSKKNVVRGLHFQWNPFMGKLVRTVSGRMVDIVLDIRLKSPTFGKAIMYDLPANSKMESNTWIWVPPGFAHGNFFTEETIIEYLCTGVYSPGCEAGISPFSEDIDWSLCDKKLLKEFKKLTYKAVISEKDQAGLSVKQWKKDNRSKEFNF